ncbi:hypothetical protein K5N19_001961 [Vibrio parahaemolyticus]|nr:hypothetical protein [Vibrio parahaemolyticus]
MMDIDFSKVCARRTYNKTFMHYIKCFLYVFFIRIKIKIESESSKDKVLCVYSIDTIGPVHLTQLKDNMFSGRRNIIYCDQVISLRRAFKVLVFIISSPKVIFKLNDLFAIKYKMDAKIIINQIDFHRYSALITLCDNTPYENLFAQISNYHEIETYTCQHGLYSYFGDEFTANRTLYESLVSKNLLSWGKATELELNQYTQRSFDYIPVGNQTFNLNEIKKLKRSCRKETNIFGVILNGEAQKKNNAILIKIAEEISQSLGIKYLVRMHPNNRLEDYKSVLGKNCYAIDYFCNEEYFLMTSFSIANSTGLTALCYFIGHMVFLFNKDLGKQYNNDEISFNDIESFLLIYDSSPNINELSEFYNGNILPVDDYFERKYNV